MGNRIGDIVDVDADGPVFWEPIGQVGDELEEYHDACDIETRHEVYGDVCPQKLAWARRKLSDG